MALIESLLLALAPSIAKAIRKAWLGESVMAGFADPLIDALIKSGGDKHKQQQRQKQLDTIAQQVANNMRPFFDSEAGGLTKDERAVAVIELAATLEQARVDTSLLIACQFKPELLSAHLREERPAATHDLSAAQEALYDRLLGETSRALFKLAPSLDGFSSGVDIHTVQVLDRVLEGLTELSKRPDETAEQFERDYREAVARKLNRMEYFGIPEADVYIEQQQLSATYVTLQFELRDSGRYWGQFEERSNFLEQLDQTQNEQDAPSQDKLQSGLVKSLLATGNQLVIRGEAGSGKRTLLNWLEFHQSESVEELLAAGKRLAIQGDAGGGKSTLLKWVAVNAARQSFPAQLASWNECVPFFVRLRDRVGQSFPKPNEFIQLVAPNMDDLPPAGWVRRQLVTGRALVLIDGVDELPQQQRDEMREQIDEFIKDFPLARYIITSRSSALKHEEWPEWTAWVEKTEFVEASLQPLDQAQIELLIDKWHAALAHWLTQMEKAHDLTLLAAQLKRQLERQHTLRALATNPLLCAMLCALHHERGDALPGRRIELYEECIKMLLERRDIKRKLKADASYPSISYDQKLALLKSFALWLVRNNLLEADRSTVDERFARELPNLRLETTGDRVRAFFVERGALLREPVEGRIDFAHRTFQEFLAAQAILEDDGVRELLTHAQDDQWRDLIILAAGKATLKQNDELLRTISERAKQIEERDTSRQLHLLAIACLETAVRVSPAVSEYVLDQAADIFPPNDVDEAKLIAAAGDPVVRLLYYNPQHYHEQVAACIRALSLIGSNSALQAIADYAAHPYWQVREEIGRAWTAFDRAEYAKRVLRNIQAVRLPFFPSIEQASLLTHVTELVITQADETTDLTPLTQLSNLTRLDLVGLTQLSDLIPLTYLSTLAHLRLLNSHQLSDLTPLTHLPNLIHLELYNLDQLSDLTPLTHLPNLTHLILVSLAQLSDLAPLTHLPKLNHLELNSVVQHHDLSLLAHLPNLVHLHLRNFAQLSDLTALAHLPNLVDLDLYNLPQLSDLTLSNLPNLADLGLSNLPQLSDLGLSNLPNLARLILYDLPQLSDLGPLSNLPQLSDLTLYDLPQLSDLGPLSNLPALVHLTLYDLSQLSNLVPLTGITTLEKLDIRGTGVTDLSPLRRMPYTMIRPM